MEQKPTSDTPDAPVKPESPKADKAAPKDDKPAVAMPFEIQVDPSHAMAGREMAAIAPAVDDGSRQAYHEARAEAADNTSASSPKMGDSGANSTNADDKSK